MKKKTIAKLVVQAVAAVFGALGLVWVGMGLYLRFVIDKYDEDSNESQGYQGMKKRNYRPWNKKI